MIEPTVKAPWPPMPMCPERKDNGPCIPSLNPHMGGIATCAECGTIFKNLDNAPPVEARCYCGKRTRITATDGDVATYRCDGCGDTLTLAVFVGIPGGIQRRVYTRADDGTTVIQAIIPNEHLFDDDEGEEED